MQHTDPPGLIDPKLLPLAPSRSGMLAGTLDLYSGARPADIGDLLPAAPPQTPPTSLPPLPDADDDPAPRLEGLRRRVRTAGTALSGRLPSAQTLRAAAAGLLVGACVAGGAVATLRVDATPQAVQTADVGEQARVGKQDERLLLALDARDRQGAASTAPSVPVSGIAAFSVSAPGAPGAEGTVVAGAGMHVDGSVDLIKPVQGAVEGSGYGMRFHPILNTWKMHNGTDFPVGCGTPVYASAAGTVTHAAYRGPSGNAVEIDHGDLNGDAAGSSFSTHYFHLSAFGVRVGDHVEQGQFIGLSGTTGRSTGCHLHFEVMVDGVYVDPMSVLGESTATPGAGVAAYGEQGGTWSDPLPAEDAQHKQDALNDPEEQVAPATGSSGAPPSPAPVQVPAEKPVVADPAPKQQDPATTSPAPNPTHTKPAQTKPATQPAPQPAPDPAPIAQPAPEPDPAPAPKPADPVVEAPVTTPATPVEPPTTTAPNTTTSSPSTTTALGTQTPTTTDPATPPVEDPDPTEDPATEPPY